ncbi:hypothetical protein LWI28_015053 [Acer negundo]|uniref:Uncharacterized protein n=1 Tax=Acer negundo TaxID=4023 RepID=A0AAD5IU99_ACENE|nr:hypothetical protein LWI28_015053 [Acer negundo]
MDLDLALWIEQPASLTDASSSDDRQNFEKWNRSNRMSLMIIKRGILEVFRGAVFEEITKAKEFLSEIEKRFAKNNKAETSMLLQSLISMKYKGKGNIREYIMEMSHIAYKLKTLKLERSDDLLVHLVLISLPAQYGQFKDRKCSLASISKDKGKMSVKSDHAGDYYDRYYGLGEQLIF